MANILKKGQILIERYLINDYIAEGGMQQVYAAQDLSFNRIVALKVPKNDSAERRFERSARLSARINHSNVAKTLDYFENDGKSFMVEEYIDGIDLGQYRDKCTIFDPHLASHILHHLARAIAASHRVGVTHRDLKPSNIMVGKDFAASIIKITDFGIAKMAEEEISKAVEGGDESISTSQTAVGALPYMAPEMILDSRNTSPAVDIWSIGALIYCLLSGEPPYGRGLLAVPRILDADPLERPSVWNYNRRFEPLLTDLFRIVVNCIAKDPEKRPTAKELLEQCNQLAYIYSPRESGTIQDYPVNNWRYGFIRGDDNAKVFFHRQSFFSDSKPKVGMKVVYSKYPGEPYFRAFPVLPIK